MDAKSSVKSRSISPIASRSRSIYADSSDAWRQLTTPDLEKKEVSSTLSFIRKLHDQVKESNIKKRSQILRLRKEIESSKGLASSFQSDHKEMEEKIEALKQNLEITQLKYEEEMKNRNIYLHVFDRMKMYKLSLDRQANDLRSDLRKSMFNLGSESDKLRKAKESNFQLRTTINEMRQSLDAEKKSKMMELEQVTRTVKMRSEALLRRGEREKRHQAIADATADFEKNSSEMIMKESLLLNKFWFYYLEQKATVLAKESEKQEKAYLAIKSCTNADSMEDMVEILLTRETTYEQLIQNAEESEKKIDELKSLNTVLKKELNEIQLLHGLDPKVYREIQKLDTQIEELLKESENEKEQVEKYTKIYDRVSAWAVKMARLLKMSNLNTVDESLYNLFIKLAEKLSEMFSTLTQPDISESDWARITQELEFGIRTETTFSRLKRVAKNSKPDSMDSYM